MNKLRFNALYRRVRPNLFSTAAAPPSAGQSQSESYNTAMQAMHWIVGGSILACVGFVQAAQWEKPGKKRGQLMFYHKSFGLLAAGLMVRRCCIHHYNVLLHDDWLSAAVLLQSLIFFFTPPTVLSAATQTCTADLQ